MPRQSPYVVHRTAEERRELEGMARRYTSPYCDVVRARIILMAAEGLSNDLIAARLDTPRQIVSKWRKRFGLARLPGLEGSLEAGVRPAFPPASSFRLRHWPANFLTVMLPLSRLSIKEIRQHVIGQGLVAKISIFSHQ